MRFPRRSGILLHPTSLPGRFGIGDLGDEAYRFVDFLAAAGQSYWQVLPLSPTGYGDSPYQGLSAFAGNPLLISPDKLVEAGHLSAADLAGVPAFPGPGRLWRGHPLQDGAAGPGLCQFSSPGAARPAGGLRPLLRRAGRLAGRFALFMALKEAYDLRPWNEWEPELETRQTEALASCRAVPGRPDREPEVPAVAVL